MTVEVMAMTVEVVDDMMTVEILEIAEMILVVVPLGLMLLFEISLHQLCLVCDTRTKECTKQRL